MVMFDDHSYKAVGIAARAGYGARGAVYMIIGGLALLAAVGSGGQTSDSKGALRSLLDEPLGDALLVAIGLGLVGYAVWRCVQATLDTDDHGTDASGLTIRLALAVSAATHVMLAVYAFSLVFTIGQQSGGGGSQGATAWLLQQPFGQWLVAAVGVAIMGAGVAHAVKGWRADFERFMRFPASVQGWANPLCRFGLVVRGLVLIMVGGFFCVAAWQADSSEAGGLGKFFAELQSQPFGSALLGFAAAGLFAFGAYSMLEAVYRRVDAPALIGPEAPW